MNEPKTLKEFLDRIAAEYGDTPALTYVGEDPYSYNALHDIAVELQGALREAGIRKGDTVAILSENKPTWGITYLAVTAMGAVAVPILPDFHPDEIRNILEHSEASLLFISDRMKEKMEEHHSSLPPMVTIETPEAMVEELGDKKKGILARAVGRITRGAPEQQDPLPEDLAVIIYTSGTTGQSKGVMLTHRNLSCNSWNALSFSDITRGERFLSVLPLAHTYECTIGFLVPMLYGATVHYLRKPASPSVLLPALKEVSPEAMLAVPLFIEKIFRNRVKAKFDSSRILSLLYRVAPVRKLLHKAAGKKLMETFGGRLRFFGIGGAALAPDVERFLREARFPYAVGYGLTETSPLVAGASPWNIRYRSTGPAIPGVEVELRDVDSKSGEGELYVRGPNVMVGYYKDPEKTREVLDEEGWFRTGDLATIDGDGHITIRGRSKNVIVGPSGENIYPEAIESLINSFRFVVESLVLEQGGKLVARVYLNYEELKANLAEATSQAKANARENNEVMKRQVQAFLADLRKRANQHLNAYSRLSRVEEMPEPFEKTPSMKIKRYLYTNR
ncbi:MAG: AMP-binding protein [Alkalispirochaetaceae bacterium]